MRSQLLYEHLHLAPFQENTAQKLMAYVQTGLISARLFQGTYILDEVFSSAGLQIYFCQKKKKKSEITAKRSTASQSAILNHHVHTRIQQSCTRLRFLSSRKAMWLGFCWKLTPYGHQFLCSLSLFNTYRFCSDHSEM